MILGVRVALTVVAALPVLLVAGCGRDSAQLERQQFDSDMAAWNQCRQAAVWHTVKQLYAICGPIPPLPSR